MHPRSLLAARTAGLLLHPTALPGPHGCGDLGAAAREFVDFLAASGLRWWQMLPIGPPGPGNSPYSAVSACAGNPLLISLDELAAEGLLDARDAAPFRDLPAGRVAYASLARHKLPRLRRAYEEFVQSGGLASPAFARFCTAHAGWLADYALYMALRAQHSRRPGRAAWSSWNAWPAGIRRRRPGALATAARAQRHALDFERFLQFTFARQWAALRRCANQRGLALLGDIPIFVAHDSSDVWAHPDLFDLDARGNPRTVSGVPPDLFSRTGQRWGHPHYRWPRHAATGFAWWVARFWRTFELFDAARIDHFLGFSRVWAVPARAKTAGRGKWVDTPGQELFSVLRRKLGPLPIIAEDLGLLTPAAAALRDRFGFPGMRLLHFAFGADAGSAYHLPHTHPRNCVVYPGTHDNDTTVGWLEKLRAAGGQHRRQAGQGSRRAVPPRARRSASDYDRLARYVGAGRRVGPWDVIRLVLLSPANTAIVPVQDILGLDNRARMNTPATARGNWEWRLSPGDLTPRLAARLRELVETYGRLPAPAEAR